MSISEQIVSTQEKLVSLKDELVEVSKSLEENQDDPSLIESMESLSTEIELKTKSLETLQKAENTLALKAVSLNQNVEGANNAPKVVDKKHLGSAKADLLVKTALCTFESYIKRVPIEQIIEERYNSDDQVKAVAKYTLKGAQNPAFTTVDAWAGELTQESYGQFMDLLSAESVIPRMGLTMHDFMGYNSIKIPMRAVAAAPKNLAGAFRAEGAPIRVGAASLSHKTLTPKNLGVIGTWSNELFERSGNTKNIETLIREFMVIDTTTALEGVFFGATAGSATQPAGIQNGLAAGDTAVSGGVSAAAITADLRGRLTALAGHNMGKNPVWVMNPARFWGVSLALTATGTTAFPETANGLLLGIPVLTSTNIPADVVYLVDAGEVSYAGGNMNFKATDVATLHEEDTTPLPIVSSTGPATADPVRSLFQTNTSALRMMMTVDWAVMRPGAVQTITACGW